MAQERVATTREDIFKRGELACVIGLAWALAAAVVWTITGEAHAEGRAAAIVAVTGLVYLGMFGAPMAAGAMVGAGLKERAMRAALLAALAGAVSSAAYAACVASTPSPVGVMLTGPLTVALAAYAFFQLVATSGRWYASALVLWLGAPPFVFYVLLDMARLPVGSLAWLLPLSPASAAATTFGGGAAWPGLMATALVGAALTTLPAEAS